MPFVLIAMDMRTLPSMDMTHDPAESKLMNRKLIEKKQKYCCTYNTSYIMDTQLNSSLLNRSVAEL